MATKKLMDLGSIPSISTTLKKPARWCGLLVVTTCTLIAKSGSTRQRRDSPLESGLLTLRTSTQHVSTPMGSPIGGAFEVGAPVIATNGESAVVTRKDE